MENRKEKFVSLQVKVFLMIVFILILPLGVCGIFFYWQNARVNRQQMEAASLNSIEQKGLMLEYMFSSIQQNSLRMYQDENVREYLLAQTKEEKQRSYIKLNETMLNFLAYDKSFSGVDIWRQDGEQYNSSSAYKKITNSEAAAIANRNGKLSYMGTIQSRYEPEDEVYVFSRKINDINDLGKALGIMCLYIPKNKVQGIFAQERAAYVNEYYIVENGSILIASDKEAEGIRLADRIGHMEFSGKQGVEQIKVYGEQRMVSYYHLSYPEWYLVNIMSCEQILSQNHVFLQMFLMILILAMALCIYAAFAVSAHILAPLKKVTGAMKNLEKENFRLEIPVISNDEISVLASSFNKMSTELDKQVNQIHVSQLSEKNAQIKALQAYINPHFLYNTLDVICWMARMENAEETCGLVEALSKIFRMSVHTGTRVFTVEEELEYIGNYLTIQRCRYADSIDFVMDVEECVVNCETISFVLQPLIENAITHGLDGKEGLVVTIHVKRKEDMLVYIVEDDGAGADIEELHKLLYEYEEGKRGMAISSVHNRIRLYYGERYGLHFEKGNTNGIRAVVEQPYKVEGDKSGSQVDDCR